MAGTEPDGPVESGTEGLSADVSAPRGPRVSTRALVVVALLLVAVFIATLVVHVVLIRQPRLVPVPVPSVSAIS